MLLRCDISSINPLFILDQSTLKIEYDSLGKGSTMGILSHIVCRMQKLDFEDQSQILQLCLTDTLWNGVAIDQATAEASQSSERLEGSASDASDDDQNEVSSSPKKKQKTATSVPSIVVPAGIVMHSYGGSRPNKIVHRQHKQQKIVAPMKTARRPLLDAAMLEAREPVPLIP